jgi:MFS transporter, DHA1 family, multidrug resistance protein
MADLIRDAPFGQMIRFITRNKVLQYPEERSDFQCPTSYAAPDEAAMEQKLAMTSPSSASADISSSDPTDAEKANLEPAEPTDAADAEKANLEPAEPPEPPAPTSLAREQLERMETSKSGIEKDDMGRRATTQSTLNRVNTKTALQQSRTQADLEAAYSAAYEASLVKEPTRPIIPQRTSNGEILVDWYTTDDPENPQNWSQAKKAFASFWICLYTLAYGSRFSHILG